MAKQLNSFGFNLNNVTKLLDPINVDKQLKYYKNGLTYVSNNMSVIPRDEAGNITLQENSTTNTLLIIEPTANKITTKSMLRIIDTQFKYFKFPARTNVIEEEPVDIDLDLDLNIDTDPIFARYKPSENRTINSNSVKSGILMDDVVDGMMQQKPNGYYITKEIKNSGADLRFRIVIVHRYDSDITNDSSTAFFSLMKSTVEAGLDREYKTYVEPNDGVINQYEVRKLVIDEIIPNEELEIGDVFSIGAVSGIDQEFRYHTINSDTSYWVITDASKNVDEWNQEIN
jgi:hypothetical protein